MPYIEANYTSNEIVDWGWNNSAWGDKDRRNQMAAGYFTAETYVSGDKTYLKVRVYCKTGVYSSNYSTSSATSQHSAVSIYLKIGDKLFFDNADGATNGRVYYVYPKSSAKWNNFPTELSYDDGYAEEIFEIANNTTSLSYDFRIMCAQDFVNNDTRFNNCLTNGNGNTSTSNETYNTARASGTITRTSYTNLTGGSITLVDNGNNTFHLEGKNAKEGTNNPIASSSVNVKIYNTTDTSGEAARECNFNPGTTSEATFRRDYNAEGQASYKNMYIDANTKKIVVSWRYNATYGSNITGTTTYTANTNFKYYMIPNNPTSIWYISDNKEKSTDTKYSTEALRPKVKKELAWNWAGATPGNSNSSITGYRIFIYKNEVKSGTGGTSMHISSAKSDADSSVTPVTAEDSGTRGHAIETTQTTNTSDNLNFKFVPKDAGFAANDTCCCRVFSVTTWGDGTEHYSSGGIRLDCVLKNGVAVWIKIPKPDDPDTLEWKEGAVYVHNGSGWKEAEGVYVHDGSGWEEAT
jgi:hypothetical protein